MNLSTDKPYVLYVAETIYLEILKLKKNDNLNNIEAFERFIGSQIYKKISSGKFHDEWFNNLEKNNFIDKDTGKKIPSETIRLLEIQKNTMIKQFSTPNYTMQKAIFLWKFLKEHLIIFGVYVKVMNYGVKKQVKKI